MRTKIQLFDLAWSALESHRVLAVSNSGQVEKCTPPPGVAESTGVDYGPIVGVVCPKDAGAVAFPIDVSFPARLGAVGVSIALAVPRHGVPVVVGPDHLELHPQIDVHTMFDLGLRSLGSPTPPPDRPLIELLDRIWLDRILSVTLAADLGFPPGWPHLGSLHPALPSLTSPDRLGRIRAGFNSTWESLRHQVAGSRLRWTGMPPGVAAWLDEGAFARWCLADTPDPGVVIGDLSELLDPPLLERIVDALDGDLHLVAVDSSRHQSEL